MKTVTGADVRRLRSELGLSQAELAKLLGLSSGTVANWETRNRMSAFKPETSHLVQSSPLRGLMSLSTLGVSWSLNLIYATSFRSYMSTSKNKLTSLDFRKI